MKKAHCEIGRACTWLTGNAGAWIAALAVIWVTAAPGPAWGQSSWPSYPNNTAISVTSGGNVGIGTTTPVTKLNIANGTAFAPGANVTGALSLSGYFGGGLIFSDGPGYAGIWSTDWGGMLNFAVNGSSSGFGSAYGQMVLRNGNLGIGTMAPQYKLAVNGTIGAKEVIVTNTGWSDYVFRPGYRLRPLREVSRYIQANGHLPDIPTEAEVKEKGVSLGDMQAKLLAKVEELTLHLIQQDKENRGLRARLAKLEHRVAGQ